MEVRLFHQYQRVFDLSSFSVGQIVCGEGPSQHSADPVAATPLPLTNQDRQETPLQEPKKRAEPSNLQMKGVLPVTCETL